LYSRSDLARLQQVLSLRQLGFSLEEIAACLDQPEYSPRRVVRLHLESLKAQLAEQERLIRQLEHLDHLMAGPEDVSAQELVKAIEEMVMFEKYYTKEQLEKIKRQGEKVGEQRIKAVEAEWPK